MHYSLLLYIQRYFSPLRSSLEISCGIQIQVQTLSNAWQQPLLCKSVLCVSLFAH